MGTTTYEGLLAGLVGSESDTAAADARTEWSFEGRPYDTPADEAAVLESVGEALTEPERNDVVAARDFVFGQRTGFQYTSQALLAMLVAYERECEGGDGVEPVVAILREAARRIAVIEALTT